MKTIIGICIILCTLVNWTNSTIAAPIYPATIRPSFYNFTSFSPQEDSTIKWWINFKNTIPRFSMRWEWQEFNSYRPQYRQYNEGLGMVGIYYLAFFDFCILLSSLLLFFKIYFCGKDSISGACGGKYSKTKVPRSSDALIVPLVLLAICACIYYVGIVITSYGNIVIYLGVRQTRDLAKSEAEIIAANMNAVRDNLTTVSERLTALGIASESEISIDANRFYSEVSAHSTEVTTRVSDIVDPALWFEIGRFVWVWLQILVSFIIIVFALAGYMPCKFAGIVVAGSVIIFVIFLEISALLAYSSSEILMISDICEQAYRIGQTDRVPQGETGIGYFMVPISPAMTGVVNLYILKAGRAYDKVMDSLNKDLAFINYKETPATNTQDVTNILAKDTYVYATIIQDKGQLILALDAAIRAMYDIKNDRHLRKFANDVQSKLCISALAKCPYAYVGIGLLTIADIFIVIISIQLVKLRKVPKLKAAVKMLGVYKQIDKFKHQ